jgi:DNA-binding transcriptional MerR regulator
MMARTKPRATGEDEGFSGTRTAQVVGISYRQLDYWARTDLIRPSLADAAGSGTRRRYAYRDLLELKVVKKLLDAGIRLESVREVFAYLREHMNTDVASAHLVISGSDVLLCDGDQLITVLQQGQGVLNVLPLAGVKEELDAGLAPGADGAEVVPVHPRVGRATEVDEPSSPAATDVALVQHS